MNASFYSSIGMNVIPCNLKFPAVAWKEYTNAYNPGTVSLFGRGENAIAGISGINGYALFDFDKADISRIPFVLSELGLPPRYPWVVQSGSGNGFHIWFRIKGGSGFFRKFGDKSVLNIYPKDASLCHHTELRMKNCYTILPPSSHVSGLAYSFFFDEPDSAPPFINLQLLEKFIFSHFVFSFPTGNQSLNLRSSPIKLSQYDSEKLFSATEFLSKALGSGCYSVWNKLGLALCSLGNEGLKYFLRLSKNPEYSDTESALTAHFLKLLQSYNGSISVGSVFFIARSMGWKPPFVPFWTGSDRKPVIDYNKYIHFLIDNNFSRLKLDNSNFFVYTEGHFINFIDEIFVKDYVFNYLQNLPEYSGAKRKKLDVVLDGIIKNQLLFKSCTLEFLPSPERKILKDTEKEVYIFFRNCYLLITPGKISECRYDGVDAFVFSDKVVPRNFARTSAQSDFETFCRNICSNDQQRFDSLRTSIGYLLHSFKDPATAKAIIFTDENLSNGAAGRSGKSLLAKGLSFLRSVVEIDGKNFNFSDRFAFQRVTPSTDILLFNDTEKNFAFAKLFNIITDSFVVQRKNLPEFILSFRESPKVLITCNYYTKNFEISAQARSLEHEFSGYYNIHHTPQKEFGKRFFDGWNEEEWNAFFIFMAECISFYLQNGLLTCKHVNLEKKKLIDSTSQEFSDFVAASLPFNHYFPKEDFFHLFKETEPSMADVKYATFYKWIRAYCQINNFEYHEKRINFPQVRAFAVINPETLFEDGKVGLQEII